ncbi:MAG: GDSL-type esterase/lipase family protein [Bacteroidota bacterium]|nr:GDSL-type esterase/lipase family protein [Bacteroidota bacterium]
MKLRGIIVLAVFVLFHTAVFSQIRVACVGNSITYGAGIKDRDVNSYPAQLGKILGTEWDVKNFGVSGATLLRKGDRPYWKQAALKNAISFNPNVVIIKLGTNDSKPQNWKFKNEYFADYVAMIDTFKALPAKPMVFVCYPVPSFPGNWGIRDSIIRVDILPQVKKVAKKTSSKIIDLYAALSGHADLFPDKIHPNADGAGIMAKVISENLLANKKAFLKKK